MDEAEAPEQANYSTFTRGDQNDSKNGSNAKKPGAKKGEGRKRTKTGCLMCPACRKRRIKCTEERPVCQNCVKSKRQCEGYNQRVVFKDPLNFYRPSISAPARGSLQARFLKEPGSSIIDNTGGKPLAPKPFVYDNSIDPEVPVPLPDNPNTITPDNSNTTSNPIGKVFAPGPGAFSQETLSTGNLHSPLKQKTFTNISSSPKEYVAFQSESDWSAASDAFTVIQENPAAAFSQVQKSVLREAPGVWESADQDSDDPHDISDDDMDLDEDHSNIHGWQQDNNQIELIRSHQLGVIAAVQASQEDRTLSLRSYTSFIDRPDMLANYVPTPQSSPLRDPLIAKIFRHFVNVTGPSMSMYERHTANPALIFRGEQFPKSQQHMWTYTFPALALQNQALLHAMLALGSIHIAKLQSSSTMPSLKHYHIGLRRVAKLLSSDARRKQPATLAAAMLLAFYELFSADHQKWSNHILGAKQLIREIDFAGITRNLKRSKRARQLPSINSLDSSQAYGTGNLDEIDESLVGDLMGSHVQYDEYGHVIGDEFSSDECGKNYSEKDLENYETQRDLFWWYCKQDVYQSILGGGGLFLDYSLWSICPPRATIGRLDAIYGTYDHLILLMGRLSAFGAKDLKRKRLAIKMNGGWQPPAAFRKQQSSSESNETQAPQPPRPMPQMPNFSGMVPGVQEASLPMGFEQASARDTSPQRKQSDNMDLQTQTFQAEEEWAYIKDALCILDSRFGSDFQALGPEYAPSIHTPFGLALQYRTYGIAGIWMNFYMALIFLHRVHPSMPPAAMVAAGFAARQTATYAQNIAKIAAGIAPESAIVAGVNPGIGAALIEASTCLFLAGVQYQDAEQRAWTVRKLGDISRLTGWQTALAIAAGCEMAWVKAGELGRGPPYARTTEAESHHTQTRLPDLDPTLAVRRIDRAFSGKNVDERRKVMEGTERVHYALGVLGLSEDFQKLDVDGTRQSNNGGGTQ